MSRMKKVILTKDIQLKKVAVSEGAEGTLIVQQDNIGGHLVSLPNEDGGFADVALNPNAKTIITWKRDDVQTMWTSIKVTSDVNINSPSAIDSLAVEIVDTVSARLRWNAPQGFEGNDEVSVDLYYLVISTSPIDPLYTYDGIRLNKIPTVPNAVETYIIPNLISGQRYYVGMYSDKIAYGKVKRSLLSNVGTFFTTPLDGNFTVPKRIPLDSRKIFEPLINVKFEEGERFTNYPSFKRLANQDYVVDNNGTPEGVPTLPVVSNYQSYGRYDLNWYNVDMLRVFFDLDAGYDLDYIYIMIQGNRRFSLYGTSDGVNLFPLFDSNGSSLSFSQSTWTKVPLDENNRKGVRYIVLGLYFGEAIVNGLVPYGTRKEKLEISGIKFKHIEKSRTAIERIGTNAFFAELDPHYMGDISSITRFYNEYDFLISENLREQGSAANQTPNDIGFRFATSQMWNYFTKMQEAIASGQKILFVMTHSPMCLRDANFDGDAFFAKPVDPNLNVKDLAITTNPQNYKWMARIAACLAGKLGANTNVPLQYMHFDNEDTSVGLGYVEYFEFGNEVDSWWVGDNGFQNPQEQAAFLSAIYDGHKGTLGEFMGLKDGDPNAKLLAPGSIKSNPDYMWEMMRWWDLYRGIGDYPIDVINFHHYNGYTALPDTPVYSNIPAYGLPPELGDEIRDVTEIVNLRDEYSPDKEVWCTEMGYSEQNGGMISPRDATPELRAIHKAVWLIRQQLICQMLNLDVNTQYWYADDQVRVEDLNPDHIQRELFYTNGYMDGVTSAQDRNRKPLTAYWYMNAFRNDFAGYTYSHTVVQAGVLKIVEEGIVLTLNPNLWIMAFDHTDGSKALVVWMGTDNWAESIIDFKIPNDITTVPVLSYVNQHISKQQNGSLTNVSPSIVEGSKRISLTVTEVPTIIKTNLVGTEKLIKPERLQAQGVSSTSVKLSWIDKNYGAVKTRVYQSLFPDRDFTVINETYQDTAEVTISGLAENTTYFYQIMFVDGDSISDMTSITSVSTLFVVKPPTDLVKDSATSSTITIGFSYPIGDENKIDQFLVYRSSEINGTYVQVGTVPKNERKYRDIGLVASTIYFYKFRAIKDGVLSQFTLIESFTTDAPVLDPPAIVSASLHTAGSQFDMFFAEEVKDENTALNAFTLVESFNDGTFLVHTLDSISVGLDKTKVTMTMLVPAFKDSTLTVSYDAFIGNLKSVYNVKVASFVAYPVANNIAIQFNALKDYRDIDRIQVNRNNLFAIEGDARAVAIPVLKAGTNTQIRMSVTADDSIFMGIDITPTPSSYTGMKIYMVKINGVANTKVDLIYQDAPTIFGKGLLEIQTIDGVIKLNVSYDNGLTWVTVRTAPQPAQDMYVKFYTTQSTSKGINLSIKGYLGGEPVPQPLPPTNLVMDDALDTVGWTNSEGWAITEHEYSTNYSSPARGWSAVATNPFQVGDVNIAAGDFAVRVKGGTGRNPSLALVSTVDFTGSIATDTKISVLKQNGLVEFGSNELAEVMEYIRTKTFTENLTVQFNSNDVYLVPNGWYPSATPSPYRLTIKGAIGVRPVFDAQSSAPSVMNAGNCFYTTFQNIEFRNADIEDTSGCIIRADTTKGVRLIDIIFDRGFCAVRATEGVEDFEILNAIVRNTREGTFRLGNGGNAFPDLQRIKIDNVIWDDLATPNGVIAGTSYPLKFFVLLKKCDGGLIYNNVRTSSGNIFDYGAGDVESCSEAIISRVRANSFWVVASSGTTFINCLLPSDNYFEDADGISMIHCFMGMNCRNVSNIKKIRGCIFPTGLNGTLLTSSDMPLIESDNLFGSFGGDYMDWRIADISTNIKVNAGNLSTYLLTKGQNSLFTSDNSQIQLKQNKSLRPTSLGKGLITAVLDGVNNDATGVGRIYPTDPGCWSGIGAGGNEDPDAPQWLSDAVGRTLAAYCDYGNSEIEITTNTVWIPYAGPYSVGDTAQPEGAYKARVKAAIGRNQSPVSLSPPMIEKVAGENLFISSYWVEISGFLADGANLNPFPEFGYARARSRIYFEASDLGYVKWRGQATFGLDDSPSASSGVGEFAYAMGQNSINGEVFTRIGNDFFERATTGINVVMRLELKATTVEFGYSINDEVTWTILSTQPRVAGTLYVKADQGQSLENDGLRSITYLGAKIDAILT